MSNDPEANRLVNELFDQTMWMWTDRETLEERIEEEFEKLCDRGNEGIARKWVWNLFDRLCEKHIGIDVTFSLIRKFDQDNFRVYLANKYGRRNKADPPVGHKETRVPRPGIDQETLMFKFDAACKKRNLQKKKTIPAKVLYEIAKEAGIGDIPNSIAAFKDRNPSYAKARVYASLLGYKRPEPRQK